jgi:hypothetical protein
MEQKRKREEREMVGKLPLRKKIQHLLTYYKLPIFGTLIAVFVIGLFVNDVIIRRGAPPFVNVTFYGNHMTPNQIADVSRYLGGFLDDTPFSAQEVQVDNFFRSPGADVGFNSAQTQRFMGSLMVNELDIIIFPWEYFNELLAWELFMDLRRVFVAEELETLGTRVVNAHYNMNRENVYLADLEMTPYVIRLECARLAELTGHDDLYVGIVLNTYRQSNARMLMLDLLGLE